MNYHVDIEEWVCPNLSCGFYFDTVYLLTELCWYNLEASEEFTLYYTPDDKFVPFYPNLVLRSKGQLISMDRICCDQPRAHCKCSSVDVIADPDPRNYFESAGLHIGDYAYDSNAMSMCDYCIHQYEWSCIPLRNFIRFHKTEGMFPEPLTECSQFVDSYQEIDHDLRVHWSEDNDDNYTSNKTSVYTEE